MSDSETVLSIDYYPDLISLLMKSTNRSGVNNQEDVKRLTEIDIKNLPFDLLKKLKSKFSLISDIYSDESSRNISDLSFELSCNFELLAAANVTFDKKDLFYNDKYEERVESIVTGSLISNSVRNLNNVRHIPTTGSVFDTTGSQELFISLQRTYNHIERERDSETSYFEKSIRDNGKSEEYYKEWALRNKNKKVKFISLGPLCAIYISEDIFIFTMHHLRRYIELIKSLSHLSLMLSYEALRKPNEDCIRSLLQVAEDISKDDPEMLGECIKAARQMFIYELDTSPLISHDPRGDYLSTLKATRVRGAKKYHNIVRLITHSPELRVNICNTFKLYYHPDSNLYEVFETIKGFHTPNKSDSSLMDRFNGTLRRALFKSLKETGTDVRLRGNGMLSNLSKHSKVDINKMLDFPWSAWSEVEFEICDRITKPSEYKLKSSDKSSQNDGPCSIDDLEEMVKWSNIQDMVKPSVSENFRTSNDLNKYLLTGKDYLNDTKTVFSKFNKLIKAHEEFESKYYNTEIDDIPQKDLFDFVYRNEAARTLVGTEPKLGEYHKKYTRMFYLAEQFIKSITQRVERLARQVSRKQTGVSIVKGFEGNRKDLEKFSLSMTAPGDENTAVFISFDLSEFSKKFPMKIVRAYGKILYELTGEEWLKRIDLVFRSALVIHNTRGFFSYTSGVKGGFEGFLNFVWSSCHAVIMEISLEAISLRGELLTFSDDGLLYFIYKTILGRAWLLNKIYTIQRIYKRFGLIFNLKKTMVSSMIWEYLGNICFLQKIIDMSIKECSSYGRVMRSKGIVTVADNFDRLIGQTRSLIRSGFSPNKAYFMMRYYSDLIIRRINNKLSSETIESLLITPRNCGGFRIPSLIEMMSSSTVDKDSEYIADLMLYSDSLFTVSNISITIVSNNMSSKNNALNSILLGTRFKTTGLKTNGYSTLNMLLNEVSETSLIKVSKNPLTKKILIKMSNLLKAYDNIDPTLLTYFISNLEPWDEYQRSLGMIKGNSAQKLIPKDKIKYYQKMETNNVRYALEEWSKVVIPPSKLDPQNMINMFSKNFTKDYNLKEMKKSFRTCFSRVYTKPDIRVTLEIDSSVFIVDQQYSEPRLNFKTSTSSLGWMSHNSKSTHILNVRKMLDVVASLAAIDTNSAEMVRYMCSVFGVLIPVIPTNLISSAYRRSIKSKTSQDIALFLPKYFNALSSSRYIGDLASYVYNLQRADRSTYLELARATASVEFDATYRKQGKSKIDIFNFDYKLRYRPFKIDDMFYNITPTLKPGYDHPEEIDSVPVSDEQRSEFNSSVVEHVEYIEMEGVIENFMRRKLDKNSVQYCMINSMRRQKLTDWVRSICFHSSSAIVPRSSVSENLLTRIDDIKYAIIVGAYLSLDPLDRKQIANYSFLTLKEDNDYNDDKNQINKYGYDTDDYDDDSDNEDDIENESDSLSKYIDDYDSNFDNESFGFNRIDAKNPYTEENSIIKKFHDRINAFCNSIINVKYPLFPSESINSLINDRPQHVRIVADYITNRTFLGSSKIYITRSPTERKGFAGYNYTNLYSEVYTNSLTMIYSICNELKWDRNAIMTTYPLLRNIDDILDYISIQRSYIRASKHRSISKPVNKTTELINFIKFELLLERESKRVIKMADDFLKKDYKNIDTWVMENEDKNINLDNDRDEDKYVNRHEKGDVNDIDDRSIDDDIGFTVVETRKKKIKAREVIDEDNEEDMDDTAYYRKKANMPDYSNTPIKTNNSWFDINKYKTKEYMNSVRDKFFGKKLIENKRWLNEETIDTNLNPIHKGDRLAALKENLISHMILNLTVDDEMVQKIKSSLNRKDIGPDHEYLISEPLDIRVRSRLWVRIKNIIYSKSTYIPKDKVQIHAICQEFYTNFITPFVNRVMEIPSSLYYLMTNANSHEDSFEIPDTDQKDHLVGDVGKEYGFADGYSEECNLLLSEILDNFVVSTGLCGYVFTGRNTKDVQLCKTIIENNLLSFEGRVISSVGKLNNEPIDLSKEIEFKNKFKYNKKSNTKLKARKKNTKKATNVIEEATILEPIDPESSIYLYHITTKYASNSISNLNLLNSRSGPRGYGSIFFFNGLFHVIYISNEFHENRIKSEYTKLGYKESINISKLKNDIHIDREVMRIKLLKKQYISPLDSGVLSSSMIITNYSKFTYSDEENIITDYLLCAASRVYKNENDQNRVIKCYVLVIAFMCSENLNGTYNENLAAVFNAVKNKYISIKDTPTEKSKFLNDISLCFFWVSKLGRSIDIDMDMELTDRAITALKNITPVKEVIPSIPSLYKSTKPLSMTSLQTNYDLSIISNLDAFLFPVKNYQRNDLAIVNEDSWDL